MKQYRLIASVCFMCVVFTAMHAQRKFNIDEMHEKKWQYIMNEVDLSPVEKDAVKPVFMVYEKNIWEQHQLRREQIRKLKKDKITEKEYSELNDKMINMEIKRAQYLREYHMKLREQLKPETLFKYYLAEKSFERQLLNMHPQKSKKSQKSRRPDKP